MANISWNLNVQVSGEPQQISESGIITAEAYNVIRVSIPKNESDIEVDVTSVDKDKIQLMVIKADRYAVGKDIGNLFYKLKKEEKCRENKSRHADLFGRKGCFRDTGFGTQKVAFY